MATQSVDRTDTAITVLTSNATRPVLDALASAFERVSGHRVAIVCDSAQTMLARIKRGGSADLAVLLAPAIDELVMLGRIAPASRRPFARSPIGIAVRADAPKPDITSVAAFTRTLLDARSIAHTVNGASGIYFPKLIERLGVVDQVKPKTVTRAGGPIGTLVASGEAEIAFQQISELLGIPGIEVVGPLPGELQLIVESAAGILVDSQKLPAAEALMQFFSAPACATLFRANGLEQARA
jgi:molybdate transport system substrate-binding protein